MCLQMLASVTLILAAAASANAILWADHCPKGEACCGLLHKPCCDIPDNDPNAGLCADDTALTCWEGTCKPCGIDGMPICAGAPLAAPLPPA